MKKNVAADLTYKSTKNISLLLMILSLAMPSVAEVKEEYYGKNDGYPIARGYPFSWQPKFRVGSYSGRATDAFYKERDIYFKANDVTPRTQSVQAKFPFYQNPDKLLEKHEILALMLLKDGKIVYEKYQYGTDKDSRFTSESMAKSFTAIAVGKALEEGYIKSLDQKIGDIVPEIKDSAVGRSTIHQALAMTCGHKFKFGGDTAYEYLKVKYPAPGASQYKNIYEYYNQLEKEEPGKVFSYDPHCSDALSMVISKTTGKRLGKYYEEKIWRNLKTQGLGSWMNLTINRDIDSGANLFNAVLHDYAQIALLTMNDGKVDGKEVVKKDWIDKMTSGQVDIGSYPSRFKQYGYQTWIRSKDASSWYAFLGFNGQRIYIDEKSKSILIAFSLEENHVPDTDKFWEWFIGKSLNDLM